MGRPIRTPRKRWVINPKTRIHESQKRYSRQQEARRLRRELKALEQDKPPRANG